jgi:uncharacterized membrane protein
MKQFIVLMITVYFLLTALPVLAGPDMGINYVAPLNLSNGDPRTATVSVVKLLLTFVGIIAVAIIIFGIFLAGGGEDRAQKAKMLIVGGIIGLIIILAAFLIIEFVISNVSNSLNT